MRFYFLQVNAVIYLLNQKSYFRFKIQLLTYSRKTGDRVSSISKYSEGDPVSEV